VVRALVERDPSLWLSRSWTTRSKREGESEDAYRFVDRAEFSAHATDGGFLEWAEFLGNLYGTPWPAPPGDADVVLEIDVQGAAQVVERDPSALFIFLVPPSVDEQRRRLLGRGDDPDKAEQRLAVAEAERSRAQSLGAIEVVNDDLDDTVGGIAALVAQARSRP
jgi:guanylate kinase